MQSGLVKVRSATSKTVSVSIDFSQQYPKQHEGERKLENGTIALMLAGRFEEA